MMAKAKKEPAPIRALKKELSLVNKKLQSLNALFDARPGSRIVEIMQEASELPKKYPKDFKKCAAEINRLSDEMEEQKKISKRQTDLRNSDRLVDCEFDKADLENAIRRLQITRYI